jgi:hypothetical protein
MMNRCTERERERENHLDVFLDNPRNKTKNIHDKTGFLRIIIFSSPPQLVLALKNFASIALFV